MRSIEERSDKTLDSEKYNVVKIYSVNELIAFDPEKTVDETWRYIGSYIESFIDDGTASYCYYTPRYIYLLVNDDGINQSTIISKIAAKSALYFNSGDIRTALVEFQSDTELVAYFSLKNHESFLYSFQKFGKFTKAVMNRQTIKELEKTMKSSERGLWDAIPAERKYGIHLKQPGNFSGKIDSRENTFKHFLL